MRKKKAVIRKGGTGYQEAAMRGFIPTDKLYDLANKDPTVNKIPDLIQNYQRDENYLSDKIEKYKKEKENLDKNRHDVREEELKFENLENRRLFDNRKNTLKWTNFYKGIVGATVENFKQLGSYGTKVAGSAFTFLGFAGNGVILRVILIIVALALIIGLGLASMYFPQFNDAKNRINAKMNELVYPDFDNYLKGPNPFKRLNDMMKNLKDRIPGNLKYKYDAFINSLSYITTGKNQYENFLVDREMITSGRSDNIIHMHFNNLSGFQNDKTYCALQPKPIILNFNSNLYPSADYNQLDQSLREDLKYPDSYQIPITSDPNNGRYDIDINGSKYSYGDFIFNRNQDNYLPKLFKKDKNKIVFNDKTVSSFNLLAGVIGMYGVSLLNKKHKDPIIVINDFNENNNNIKFKTSLYYGDDKTYKYYDKNNILQNFNFDKSSYYNIEMLLDQSGNNRHFVWKDNDNKYNPTLVKKDNNEFAIKFESRNILYQNIPIAFPKMFIKSTIIVNNKIDNFNKIDNYMDFLSTTTSSSIKLTLSSDKNNYNITTDPPFDTSNNPINNDYQNMKYSVNSREVIMTNLDNGKIETIGCILDARNENQKIEDNVEIVGPLGLAKARNIDRLTITHNFVGYLYDLYIYDRTKMM
jgi:hypothetical protein